MSKESTAKQAIEDAWWAWLQDHPISMASTIEVAVERTFRAWLDENDEDIKERIVKALAEANGNP